MKISAGILLYRKNAGDTEFFLVHPGGPYFKNKDAGWWTIPKGELLDGEEPLQAAIREFEEETGYRPHGIFTALTPIRQKGGKQVLCWAARGDLEPEHIVSNTFEMTWPPGSGRIQSFPEIDRAGWFPLAAAKKYINERQAAFLDEVIESIGR